MNKEEQLNSDKKVLASLEAEYKRAQRVIYSIRTFVTDLNFEELMPDSQERCLMVDELQAYDYIRTNLMNRIRFYRARVKKEESIKDWSQYKKTDSTYIGVDVSNEGSHSECCQVCGDGIATQQHHCGQDATCQVGDGSAVVNEIPDSIKSLEGMQVIKVCGPKCKDCPCGDGLREYPSGRDMSSCVKIELVGGYYLCLADLPNSVVTE